MSAWWAKAVKEHTSALSRLNITSDLGDSSAFPKNGVAQRVLDVCSDTATTHSMRMRGPTVSGLDSSSMWKEIYIRARMQRDGKMQEACVTLHSTRNDKKIEIDMF